MKRNRFLDILRFLHFNDPNDPQNEREKNPLYLAQPLIKQINKILREIKSGKEFISVDEEILKFKGRTKMKQYIKDKKHKWGFKIYTVSEPSGYTLKIKVYAGKEAEETPGDMLKTEFIILDILDDFKQKGFKVTLDRGFGSVSLIEKLDEKGFGVLCVMLPTRKRFPAVLKKRSKDNPGGLSLKPNKTKTVQLNNITIMAWRDRRTVYHGTNYISASMVQKTRRKKGGGEETYDRPAMNEMYCKTMKGTDMLAQRESYYTSERKTIRWYKKFYIHFIQILELNSFLLHQEVTENRMRHIEFRMELINELTKFKEPTKETVLHFPVMNASSEKSGKKSKRCTMCKNKRTIYACGSCLNRNGNPQPLCVVPCFGNYHQEDENEQQEEAVQGIVIEKQ